MTKRSEKNRFRDGGENTDWQLKTSSISEYSRLVQIWKAGARRPSGCQLNIGKKNMKNKTDISQKCDLKKKKLGRRKDRIQKWRFKMMEEVGSWGLRCQHWWNNYSFLMASTSRHSVICQYQAYSRLISYLFQPVFCLFLPSESSWFEKYG